MTYFKFRWLFFLIIFVLCGYYLLLFCSKLTGIDFFSLIAWGFRFSESTGGHPYRFFYIFGIIFYPLIAFAVLLFLETPVQIFQMKNHHAGGLLGYRDGSTVQVYDPSRNAYIAYEHLTPPPAASKFTKAFKVVLLYKYRPSSEYYRDIKLLSLSFQLQVLLVAAIGLVMVSISLYGLVDGYIEVNGLPIILSPDYLAIQFQENTGMPLVKALLIALFIYIFVLGAGIFSVGILRKQYRDLYSYHQQTLKSNLLNSISPMKTIKGTVIRRSHKEKSISIPAGSRGNRFGRGSKTAYYYVPVFTVEFRNLIQIPVYLNVTTRPLKSAREDEEILNRLFSDDKWEDVPNEMAEFDFIVNPDYSVSLKRG